MYSRAFSDHYGPDYRREHIDQFKLQNNNVTIIIVKEVLIYNYG